MNIVDKECCFGCCVCSDICSVQAVTMELDEDRFAYPIINPAKCTACRLCAAVCPSASSFHHRTNPLPSLFAFGAKHTAAVRRRSASGGVFTALSDQILLDGGVVYGAAFDENLRLCHGRAQTKAQMDRQRDSKYVQSDTAGIFLSVENDLRSGVRVLFTGCPCQVDAMKRYLSLRPGLKAATERLYLADILCSGVPSPQLFEDFITFVQHKKKAYHRIYLPEQGKIMGHP
jgi:coenzyme F420-reducing hydrogenase beta subunit